MRIIKNERIIPYDIDGTLIYYGENKGGPTADIYDAVTNSFITVNVNWPMVRLFHEEYSRGGQMLVWSRSGWKWAKHVILALQLDICDPIIMSKPLVYFDDSNVDTWLKDRVYLEPDTKYKNTNT